MTAASLQSFKRTIQVGWKGGTEANGKALLLRVARAGHARIMADAASRSGSQPAWDAYANQEGNTNLDSVKLPGPIVYRYRYFGEMIQEALAALRAASPVQSGAYRDSHTVYVDGSPVNGVPKLSPGQQIIISNPVPYARRLEIGKTESGRDFVISVPNRIYERVATEILIPKYRRVAKISFGYATLAGGGSRTALLSSHYRAATGRLRKRSQHIGETMQAPAIFIEQLM